MTSINHHKQAKLQNIVWKGRAHGEDKIEDNKRADKGNGANVYSGDAFPAT